MSTDANYYPEKGAGEHELRWYTLPMLAGFAVVMLTMAAYHWVRDKI